MFFTFLHKEANSHLDISVFMKFKPEELLYFYYGSSLYLDMDLYQQMQNWNASDSGEHTILQAWLSLINEELVPADDFKALTDNPYNNIIGPYYYLPTNTSFFITRHSSAEEEKITGADISLLYELQSPPPREKELLRYLSRRKKAKKSARNKEDLLTDIKYCLISLQEIEKLNRHLNFLNQLSSKRKEISKDISLVPLEPICHVSKPQQNRNSDENKKVIPFVRKRRPTAENDPENFAHQLKEYYIQYREYEKACERYKQALLEWPLYVEPIREFLHKDQSEIEHKKYISQKNMQSCNDIISQSYIHSDYQEYSTLNLFKHYLETGRARNLQDCMNLYEEEKRWEEVKSSQERIENTIHYIKPNNENLIFAGQEFNEILKKKSFKI